MKIKNNSDILRSSFVELHGDDWLAKQRVAGKSLSEVMSILVDLVNNETQLSLLELSRLADSELTKRNCTATFKNYKGFPEAVCISVNNQLVHGIPTDYKLQDGDLISLDFGATFQGAIADSAVTMIYGKPGQGQDLINTTQKCLYDAIRSIRIGKNIGIIGHTINKAACNAGYNVIYRFGGHGITWNSPHAEPFVSNKSNPDEGIRIQSGLTIAIEPLLVPGNCGIDTYLSEDGWTICTNDISAHFEHTLYIHEDHVEIMSWREDEKNSIDKNIYF